jgi:hypothetical protein
MHTELEPYPALPPNVVERAAWYEKNMKAARLGSTWIDVATIATASAVPMSVAFKAATWVPALLGTLSAVAAGTRQTFDWKGNWTSFTRASQMIQTEIVSYSCGRHPYEDKLIAPGLLAAIVEEITAAETGTWAQRVRTPAGAATSPKPETVQVESP